MRKTIPSLFVLTLLVACGKEPPTQDPHAPASRTHADPLRAPLGLADVELVKADGNPLTAKKAALGKKLFFDNRLSKSGKMNCASCHHVDKAFTDGQQFSQKDSGKRNSRNAPTMYNVGYYPELYWDGRTKGLEQNTKAAWTGQLGGDPAAVAAKLNAVPAYEQEFQAAFGAPASEATIVQAISSFLRTLRSGNSAYDRFQNGEASALSEEAKKGMELFMGKAGCQTCHTPPLFTDRLYHNVGIGMNAESPDMGRAKKTKNDQDKGKFKTPTLREIAKTAPYFHDGSVKTLREAVKLMASGGIENPHRQAMDKALLTDKQLSDEEIDQLVAFLQALSGDVPFPAPAVPE